jgi:hypothetical protein
MTVHILSYRSKHDGAIDTTSRSMNWSRGLSPFYLGPCELYGGHVSKNMENAWQYAKVYPEHTDGDGNPTESYFEWAQKGWNKERADRYPMGHCKKPLYSWWDGRKLDYITARQEIYIPLYSKAVRKTTAFATLKRIYEEQGEIWLRDFDGYDYTRLGGRLKDVITNSEKKMGHAFVLAMMLMPPDKW